MKNYEYNGRADAREKNKKWSLEPPTDSHLLLYLFCAYLEHPKWMLHLDPSSYTGTQSSRNPLFLGVLPPKERFPEKYVAVISGVPSTLHPGALVLAVDKLCPPTFALYWDKKVQFTLQVNDECFICIKVLLSYSLHVWMWKWFLKMVTGTGTNSAMGLYTADVPQNQGGVWRCCSWDESWFFSS